MQVLAYVDAFGRSPFWRWFANLDPQAATKITIALTRIEQGNLSNVKPTGAGVFEYRVNFGPGYRIILGVTANLWSFCLVAGPNKDSNKTLRPRMSDGQTKRRKKEHH